MRIVSIACFTAGLLGAGGAAAAGLGIPAVAAHGSGPYFAFAGGVNFLQTQTIPSIGSSFGPQPGGYIGSNTGGLVLGSVGWAFGNGLRIELEGGYRSNGFDRATAGSLKHARAGGRQETTSVFANAFYDIDLSTVGLDTPITPYIGGGVGAGWAQWNNVTVTTPGEIVRHNDTDGGIALQGIVGVAAPLFAGISLTLEYRLMGFVDDRNYQGRVEKSPIGPFPITTKVEGGLNHSVLVGLRYAFGT